MKELLQLVGRFQIEVTDKHGRVKARRDIRNLIVNDGLDFGVALILDSVTPTLLSQLTNIAVGSDGTPVTPADVSLLAELATVPFANYTKGGTGVATVDATLTGITGNIAEAGMFDVSVRMFNRIVFDAIPLVGTDNVKMTFTLTLTNAP